MRDDDDLVGLVGRAAAAPHPREPPRLLHRLVLHPVRGLFLKLSGKVRKLLVEQSVVVLIYYFIISFLGFSTCVTL